MQWSSETLLKLPTKDGFYLRGNEMSRIETFVAAAFAFLLTMVMVAGNDIPDNIADFKMAVLRIPAFAICSIQIIWIWYEHSVWSRRFGFEDALTVLLSGILIVIVMVYVYPLKAMSAGMLHSINSDLPGSIVITTFEDLRFLFLFFSLGFLALTIIMWFLQKLAISRRKELALTPWELYSTVTESYAWMVMILTSSISILFAVSFEGSAISYAGIIYAHLGITLTILHRQRAKRSPALTL